MQVTPYMQAAIEGELAKLQNCGSYQDITMNNVAIALAGMVKGWGLDEIEIRGRFFDACRSLPNLRRGEPWTERHYRSKWDRGMRDAEPRTLPMQNGTASEVKEPSPKLSAVDLPEWTEPSEDGWPTFEAIGKEQPAKSRGELRRHVYMRDGQSVRCKIKRKRYDGTVSWIDYFRVVRPSDGAIGWQAKKPAGYVEAPYFKQGPINPFDPELAGELLFITEGEKDADTLADHELCAISAGSQAVDWSEYVRGRQVIVFGDNDDAGRRFAERQARLIMKAAAGVKVYTFPELEAKGDATDFIAAHGVEKLLELVAGLEEFLDQEFPAIDVEKLLAKPSRERLWLVPDWIPFRDVAAIGADGGLGKTTLALQLAVACAEGREWLGHSVRQCSVVYLSAEEDRDELHFRLEQIAKQRPTLEPLKNIRLIMLAGKNALLAHPGAGGVMQPTEQFQKLKVELAAIKAGLLILDSTADVFGGNENERAHVRSFITLLRGLALELCVTVLLLIHPSVDAIKTGRGYSGSTHWNNSVRARMYFTNAEIGEEGEEIDTDLRLLELAKANRARKGLKILLRWKDHCFVVEQSEKKMDGVLRALECETLFMDLLKEFENQGRPPSPNKSNNFAATLFSQHPKGKSFKAREYRDAMNTLLGSGKIKIVEIGPPSKRSRVLQSVSAS